MDRKRQDKANAGGLLEEELTGIVIGAFYETYNVLGFGFLEAVYVNALAEELQLRGVKVRREVSVDVLYKGKRVGRYRLDLLAEERLVIEAKATERLGPRDKPQLFNCLRATNLDVGLLLHYGPAPEVHRLESPRVFRQNQ